MYGSPAKLTFDQCYLQLGPLEALSFTKSQIIHLFECFRRLQTTIWCGVELGYKVGCTFTQFKQQVREIKACSVPSINRVLNSI